MGSPQQAAPDRFPQRQRFAAPSRLPRRRVLPLRDAEKKAVVLIADDVQDARDIYAAYFESRGVRAITARGSGPVPRRAIHPP
jgi:hypothetical protein